jgi:hypothetical protein
MTISTRAAWRSHQHYGVWLLTLADIPGMLQETHWGRGVVARHRLRRFARGGVMLKKIGPVGADRSGRVLGCQRHSPVYAKLKRLQVPLRCCVAGGGEATTEEERGPSARAALHFA